MPISPDVYQKLSNTIEFYEFVKNISVKQRSEVAAVREK